jgi:5-methyltetrahydrofolate--homocysteine methyltransferase
MEDLKQLYKAVLEGNPKATKAITERALAEGADPQVLVTEYMIPAMDEVGRLFEANEYFVPELLISARAMKAALQIVTPLLTARGAEPIARIAIGTVKGDLHDIGKNLVAALLEGGGFEVIDLGVDTPAEKFIEAVEQKNASILALSALLTTTMPMMKSTLDAVRQSNSCKNVKIIVGGAPVTQKYADEIGADGYSDNASAAVGLARKLAAK